MTHAVLTEEQRSRILRFDTCKVANAIEHLGLRLRNEGLTRPGLRCLSGGYPRVLGHALTSRVKCDGPPLKGAHSYFDLGDWWETVEVQPWPRIAVIEDLDPTPGGGTVLSDIHAHVLRSLGCHAVVTNGAVRNVESLAALGFAAFAAHLGMSHTYIRMVEFGCPVEIFGLRVAPGELVYADVHGMLQIPHEAVDDVIGMLLKRETLEAQVVDLCLRNAPLEEIRRRTREL